MTYCSALFTWAKTLPRPWCRPWPTLWPTTWPTLCPALWATGGPLFKNWAQHYCKPVKTMHAINLSHLRLSSVWVCTKRGVGHGAGHGLPYGPAYGPTLFLRYGLLVASFLKTRLSISVNLCKQREPSICHIYGSLLSGCTQNVG